MCNHYELPEPLVLSAFLGVDLDLGYGQYQRFLGPRQTGVFAVEGRARTGQWGLLPSTAKERVPTDPKGRPLMTNNARRETLKSRPAFRGAWAKGQRCLVPAMSYDEPYWGTGSNIWWRFRRQDGEPWALAGLWDEWTDPATGEVVPSYTMITHNCDAHPLLRLMHKPDPKLPPDKQDKRSVTPLERSTWHIWLHGTPEEADSLIRSAPIEAYRHEAADPLKTVPLPI